jgi:ribosomal protein S18 acetylase RimI-like enzyme
MSIDNSVSHENLSFFDNIKLKIISTNFFKNKNINEFIKMVYENFIDLIEYKSLNHNKREIYRLLNDKKFVGILLLYENKLIGYLLGEFINLNDGRFCYYISYIFVSFSYRNKGFASKMLDKIFDVVKKTNCTIIVLTMDTDNHQLLEFYMKRGFYFDILLRKYDRHDVLSLNL